MNGIGKLTKSFMVEDNLRRSQFCKVQLPNQYQIGCMFEKNGFRTNNVVTKDQLKQLFDRQYTMNNLGQNLRFSPQIFEQLWQNLQLLSDSTVKIQNVSKVLHDGLKQLQGKLDIINSPRGIEQKRDFLQEMDKREKQLDSQIQLGAGQFDSYLENVRAERDVVRLNISKVQTQINEMQRDKQGFQDELKMLLLVIGQIKSAPLETIFLEQGIMNMVGLQKKEKSNDLHFVFILTLISFTIELFILSYRLSFLTILGLCFILYLLFLGYYSNSTVVYLMAYLFLTIIFDLVYVYLNIQTKLILNPLIYTHSTFLKYIAMGLIVLTVVGRIVLLTKLRNYRQVPKTIQYFQFWGEEIVLNRRTKNLRKSQNLSLLH